MNIIFVNWNCFCAEDTCTALYNLGHHVYIVQLPEDAKTTINEAFVATLTKRIQEQHADAVISLNYYPSISAACELLHCPYIAWIYDNPQMLAYDKETVFNDCNHIFSFDSYMVQQLQSRGVEQIAYAPLAANVKRLISTPLSETDRIKYACDISFVGSLYTEKKDYYSQIISNSDNPYLHGYLDGLLEAQKHVYGYNFLAEALTPEVIASIRQAMSYTPDPTILLTEAEVYADFFLARKLAIINRVELLYLLGSFFDVHFYTFKETPIPNVRHRGTIRYYEEMPLLFRSSKINLNCTLRSIKNGIPLRGMDILGCGGFLLTNFQEDFLRHFEEGTHFVSYSSPEEALELSKYYLSHDDERKKIASNALQIMAREHTYEVRLTQFLESIFLY